MSRGELRVYLETRVRSCLNLGFVSTDALAGDESARLAWAERIVEESEGAVKDTSVTSVVFAIGASKPATVDSDFTVTKVNLVKQYDALRALNADVSVVGVGEE